MAADRALTCGGTCGRFSWLRAGLARPLTMRCYTTESSHAVTGTGTIMRDEYKRWQCAYGYYYCCRRNVARQTGEPPRQAAT